VVNHLFLSYVNEYNYVLDKLWSSQHPCTIITSLDAMKNNLKVFQDTTVKFHIGKL